MISVYALCFAVTAVFITSTNSGLFSADEKKTVLVFGGNGNVGSAAVNQLINDDLYEITIVSRGNWYFDAAERIKPHVHQIECDRYVGCDGELSCDALQKCEELMNYIEDHEMIDYVVDFSAYRPSVLQNSVDVLKGKVGLYIYISSDSVYEVCVNKEHNGFTKETDAVLPSDVVEENKRAVKDLYGYNKLMGEKVLEKQKNESGFDYLVFRMPDVIGPRDTTNRFWKYHLWVKYFNIIGQPIYIPPIIKNLKLSFVYVEDVGRIIRKSMLKGVGDHYNQAYNLGFSEELTLSHLLLKVSELLEVPEVIADYETADAPYFFPSVTLGAVDIQKAINKLEYKPTPFNKAMPMITDFYEMAFYNFPKDRDAVVADLLESVVPETSKEKVLNIILEHARLGPPNGKEEL